MKQVKERKEWKTKATITLRHANMLFQIMKYERREKQENEAYVNIGGCCLGCESLNR